MPQSIACRQVCDPYVTIWMHSIRNAEVMWHTIFYRAIHSYGMFYKLQYCFKLEPKRMNKCGGNRGSRFQLSGFRRGSRGNRGRKSVIQLFNYSIIQLFNKYTIQV